MFITAFIIMAKKMETVYYPSMGNKSCYTQAMKNYATLWKKILKMKFHNKYYYWIAITAFSSHFSI